MTLESARHAYAELCRDFGTDPIVEEQAILAIGREHLPPCAVAVLDNPDAVTEEYYDFLTAQTQAAQDEHDREVASGYED
jgi:hypothetical protein